MNKFAKTALSTILVSVLMCLYSLVTSASVQPKRVLVICSHSETSDYAETMLSPLVDLSHNREDLRIFTAYLRMTSLSGVEELRERVHQIADEFTPGPDLVVIVGGSGYMLADCIERAWPGMPVILSGENDYMCPPEYTIRGVADDSVEKTPVSTLRPDHNVTLIHTPVYVDRTVELLKSLIPGLEKIYLVAGENYYSRQQQILFEKTLKEFYPSLGYEILLSTEMNTEQLIGRMQYVNPEKDGVIFMSWLNHNDYLKNLFISNNVLRMIDDYAPVVSMSYCDLSSVKSTLGFWAYNLGEYNTTLTNAVLSVLDNGVQPRDMDFVTISEGMPYVNVAALEKYDIPRKYAPKTTFFANKSMSKNFYLKWMIFTLLFFGILFGLLTFSIASNRLARHRKKVNIELEELAEQLRVANAEALRAQKEALGMKERAEKESAMKSLFLQNMSHDVRTPLNAIVGFSQLLGLPDEYLEEGDKDKFVSYITNNSNVLMMLVDDILNMSDVESGRYKIVIQQAHVNEICRMCQKTVEYRLQSGVVMNFTTDAPDDLTVKTDPRRVQQILTNFLTNACKHTLSGEIVIDCDSTSDPDRILFSVTDTGPGIPPEKREKIFERFTKLDAYVDGAGIGLNICTTLAQKLGAEVRLDPAYTSGARFILAIPKNS